ncbi:MAG: transporter substrate-binding domain-containing protein [Chloroflexi bacterium]|nr:transporter substrate-binding domain-containing protein [Chloroflexota bacterium]
MLRSLLILLSLVLLCLPAGAADDAMLPCADRSLSVGFYAFFEPVSYSADTDPDSPDFDTQLGYEADLLNALESLDEAGLSFTRQGIALWDEIWLRSASPDYDIVGGGITILDSRRYDADGEEQIAFTDGHVTFRQSLLARAEDAERLNSYDSLSSQVRAGALAGTTGEFRLLELTGLVDAEGLLAAGATVHSPQGSVIADGSEDFVITPARETAGLAQRTSIEPPDDSMPQIIYMGGDTGESELITALLAGQIDVVARGQVGNSTAAVTSDGALVVSALDDLVEYGGFSLDVDEVDLLACLNDKINWLTDNQRIGYEDWAANHAVFMARADLWNAREEDG